MSEETESQQLSPNRQDVVFTDLDQEGVLVHLGSKYYYSLNATGSRIWQLLEEKLPFEQIVDTMVREFEVDKDQCRKDLDEFIQVLASESLLCKAPDDAVADSC